MWNNVKLSAEKNPYRASHVEMMSHKHTSRIFTCEVCEEPQLEENTCQMKKHDSVRDIRSFLFTSFLQLNKHLNKKNTWIFIIINTCRYE